MCPYYFFVQYANTRFLVAAQVWKVQELFSVLMGCMLIFIVTIKLLSFDDH